MMGQPDPTLEPDCCPVLGDHGSYHTAAPGNTSESFKAPSPWLTNLSHPILLSPVSSVNGSTTVCDANAVPLGSWSASTCVNSTLDHSGLECKPLPSSEGRSSFPLQNAPSKGEQFSHFLEKLNTTYQSDNAEKLDHFLGVGDAPWSQYNLRLPGSICAICGAPFTSPDHEESVNRHIRSAHPYPGKNSSLLRSSSSLTSHAKSMPVRTSKDQDVTAVGSWPYDTGRASRKIPKAAIPAIDPLSGPRLILCDHPYIPHDRLLFLLNNLNPRVYPERANNFFNSLDIVAANLLERFPDDVLAQGMQNALARLEQLYQLNFSRFASDFSQWASTTYPASYTCASLENQEYTSASCTLGSSRSDAPGRDRISKSDSNTNEDEISNSNDPRNAQENNGRRKRGRYSARLLACPIRKDCQINAQYSSCTYEGTINMWGVRKHLTSRVHRRYLALCRICWEYTTNKEEFEQQHTPGRCRPTAQPRGSRVADHWLSLYTTIFPESLRLPSPYMDDPHWKPREPPDRSIATYPNAPENDNHSSTGNFDIPAFLGDTPDSPAFDSPIPHTYDLGLTPQDAEMICMELFARMVREHISPPPGYHGPFTESLITRVSQLAQNDMDSFVDRVYATANALIRFVQSHSSRPVISGSPVFTSPFEVNDDGVRTFPLGNSLPDAFPASQEPIGLANPLGIAPAQLPQPHLQSVGPFLEDLTFWQGPDSFPMAPMYPQSLELDPVPTQRYASHPWLMTHVYDASIVDGLRSAIST